MPEQTQRQRAALVIDYQNVHLTAHDVFDPTGPLHNSLIDPLKFAREIERVKQTHTYPVTVTHIEVFRGLPHTSKIGHAYNMSQKAAWLNSVSTAISPSTSGAGNMSPAHIAPRRLPTMDVTLRPLCYPKVWDRTQNKYVTDLSHGGYEKGVDVLVALAAVRLARRSDIDVVLLASRDTDLEPAIDEVLHQGLARIETVKWFKHGDTQTYGQLGNVWANQMIDTNYRNSLDTRNYYSMVHRP
ncbi:NYN domain-containing protein [Rothia nasimurium]|uniref:NYN domain-containing protein n=1 Tax=Rothia nasimurium TaxID=85336 RepID=UPI00162730D2|nr:NYN domain-containing protein [Rothia nasimurium]